MTVFIVLWLGFWFLVVPGFYILRAVGILRSEEEIRFSVQNREKNASSPGAASWRFGKRLAMAGLLFLSLLVLYGLIYVAAETGIVTGIEDLLGPFLLVVFSIAGLAYAWDGIRLRAQRKRRERQSAPSGPSPLSRLLESSRELEWEPYLRKRLWRGRLLLVASAILQLGCVGAAIAIFSEAFTWGLRARKPFYVLMCLTLAAVIWIGVRFGRMARQHYAFAELKRMASSRVPPVLFLRSFSSDREAFENAQNVLNNPMRWVDWQVESVLSSQLRQYGPFIAVGQPDAKEKATDPRAGRLYVRSDWQRVVGAVCDISRLTIIRPSFSPGVEWELNEVLLPYRRQSTAVLLVGRDGKPMTKESYLAFRKRIAERCVIDLPEHGWNSWYLWFDRSGESHLVDSESPGDAGELALATLKLISHRSKQSNEEWDQQSAWDLYIPLEYRILLWTPRVALGASLAWLLLA